MTDIETILAKEIEELREKVEAYLQAVRDSIKEIERNINNVRDI
jgi:FtsZ-binding cell division protein ZapB